MKRVMCVCAVVLAMAASPALAKGKAKAAGKSMSDQTFVTKAAKGGMAEVELGKLAAIK
jgi:predicted outer membrane protein